MKVLQNIIHVFRIIKYQLSDEEMRINSGCEFFDAFGLLVQLLLFVICLSVLLCKLIFNSIVKKSRDPIQRSWLTWFLDVSKLLVAQGTQHICNLIIAYKIGKNNGLECEWYIINLICDATLGVFFLWIYFKTLNECLDNTSCSYESGNYYDKDRKFSLSSYMYQMSLWFLIVLFVNLFNTLG